jgi:hypothetical protein
MSSVLGRAPPSLSSKSGAVVFLIRTAVSRTNGAESNILVMVYKNTGSSDWWSYSKTCEAPCQPSNSGWPSLSRINPILFNMHGDRHGDSEMFFCVRGPRCLVRQSRL